RQPPPLPAKIVRLFLSMRTLQFVVTALLFSNSIAAAQAPSPISLMPVPAKLEAGSGQLAIDQLFSVAVTGVKDARVANGAARFIDQLSLQTGLPLNREMSDAAKATLVIHADSEGRKVQEVGEDESYSLEIGATQANLKAATHLGVLC